MCIYININVYAYIHTYVYIHTYIHTYMIHICIHTYMHTYAHTYVRSVYAYIHTFKHTYIHASMNTHIHAEPTLDLLVAGSTPTHLIPTNSVTTPHLTHTNPHKLSDYSSFDSY